MNKVNVILPVPDTETSVMVVRGLCSQRFNFPCFRLTLLRDSVKTDREEVLCVCGVDVSEAG
jgi:hypothetical protein